MTFVCVVSLLSTLTVTGEQLFRIPDWRKTIGGVVMNKVQAIQNLRRSNAATAIPSKKVNRQTSRSDRKRAAIKDGE